MKAPLLLALAGLSISTAQAAEGVLTLTCQGRTITKIGTGPSKEEPMSMGVIVNFTARTVTGFRPRSDDIPVEISAVNEKAVDPPCDARHVCSGHTHSEIPCLAQFEA
jgi:hypothetical protein